MIPLCRPHLTDDDVAAVAEVLRSGHWAGGPLVRDFEKAFASSVRAPYGCALNSCASALQLALECLSQRGEVILPSFTFGASANAVVKAGRKPVFIDIDPRTGNLDPKHLDACRTVNTVAVMAVHYAGLSCDMDAITAFCERHDLALIEDCAEAAGATWRGRPVGSFGVGCFSFFPTKNMSTGEGGMVTTRDADLDRRVRTLRGHGVVRSDTGCDWRRDVAEPGYNLRMTDLQAALGLSQLKRLDAMNATRRDRAARYAELLGDLDAIVLPHEPSPATHVYQMYVVRVKDESIDRDALVRVLREAGVEASVHFDPPLHQTRAYRDVPCPVGMEVTESWSRTVVTLPMSAAHTLQEIETVAWSLRAALGDPRVCRRTQSGSV